MASTFKSNAAQSGSPVAASGKAGQAVTVLGTYSLLAALVVNDVIEMVKVPKGATILDVKLVTDDLDSSTGIVLDVGDGADTDRYIDGATIGQTGGFALMNEPDGFGYEYSGEDTIDVLVQVAPSSGATSGDVHLQVTYLTN